MCDLPSLTSTVHFVSKALWERSAIREASVKVAVVCVKCALNQPTDMIMCRLITRCRSHVVRIRLLGGLEVASSGGEPVHFATRKTALLFAALALAGRRGARREALCDA